MYLVAILALGLGVLVFGFLRLKHLRERREIEAYGIEADALHALLAEGRDVLVLDVRQPLDLLAHSEIIPGARRIPPKEVLEATADIPKDREVVVYCTCASESTSRMILRKAQGMDFTNMRFLKGGLDGWKAKGYAVEPYDQPFHLDTAS
ncbi:MAG: Rhodanese-related sulfurtransferase [Acidobacteriaceae bacterium]|nr:Rhodanese-related sulfurtransferase [Acidobacteriaceae bacterium]